MYKGNREQEGNEDKKKINEREEEHSFTLFDALSVLL
jgi:hypothetical protein